MRTVIIEEWLLHLDHIHLLRLLFDPSFLTCPFLTTGRSKTPCMPRMADCGGLMMGVPNSEPNTPPLEIVKVPPLMSSMANEIRKRPSFDNLAANLCGVWHITRKRSYLRRKFTEVRTELIVLGLGSEGGDSLLNVGVVHLLGVPQNGDDQALKKSTIL